VVLFMAACTKPPQMCIVMELMSLGSLYDVRFTNLSVVRCSSLSQPAELTFLPLFDSQLLHNELVPSIPLSLCLKMAYQAAKGMHFLHSSGIVHRDLKSLNLLLDAKWNLKVSDFGLTKFRADLKRAGGDEVEGEHKFA
jgi:serine/threonine protein kinase